ncbi:glycerophosphodiester phosphodiesterase [uncultured Paludibaculum sp.]|uniref:glycerophosphodiester phosphodiesterase n=1 Tax=uncultured Paludibaculum sp. TaxID=1765020 RepID=UPI002AAC291E|nr:glycerophosphodiester phosphodiesterase [uncultured Paludibaculum sp.]
MTAKLAILLLGCLMIADAAPKILVHGHRGARAMRPENTIPAFEYAIKAGADFLELDLAVTKDGILVVSHDPQLNPKICKAPEGPTIIHQLTLAQVRQWDCGSLKNPEFDTQQPVPGAKIPTFDEVLALAPQGTFSYNVEMKSDPKKPELSVEPAEFAKLVAAAIRKHKLEKRVVVQSFDFRTLVELRKIAPEIRISALYFGSPKSFVEISKEAANAEIVAPYLSLVKPEGVKEAHAAGLQVVPWTANKPEIWDTLIAAGVDAIITDNPAALIEHLKAKGLR